MDTEFNLQSTENVVNSTLQDVVLGALGELNSLHARITRNQGEVAAKFDEAEQFTKVRLSQIKTLKDSIREDQKRMRLVEAELFKATLAATGRQ